MVKLIIKYKKGRNKEDEQITKDMVIGIKDNLKGNIPVDMGSRHIEKVSIVDDYNKHNKERQDKKLKGVLK